MASGMEPGAIAAVAAPASADAAAPAADAPAQHGQKKERTKRPRIDLDDSISKAKQAMKEAQKSVAEARKVGRNERRKKQRLMKKAIGLSADDLERIAVLKRCGLDPAGAKGSATAQNTVMPPTSDAASSSRPESRDAAGSESPAQNSAGNTASGEEFGDDRECS